MLGMQQARTRRSRWMTIASLTALLSACASGPDYVRPADTMPAAFPHASAGATLGGAPDIGTWWMQFNDPALTAIITRVLQENLDLAAAMARVEQARCCATSKCRFAAICRVERAGCHATPILEKSAG